MEMSKGPLPSSVHELLSSSKFLHLATCSNNVPHVSLMNYTFIDCSDKSEECGMIKDNKHLILISTPINTTKFKNLQSNPRCSLLVHDWVSSKPTSDSSVLNLLERINQAEIGELSATVDADVVKVLTDSSSEEYKFFKNLLLTDTPNAKAFVNGEGIALVLLKVVESKVSDSNNKVESYK